jgi:hypothetical protein
MHWVKKVLDIKKACDPIQQRVIAKQGAENLLLGFNAVWKGLCFWFRGRGIV